MIQTLLRRLTVSDNPILSCQCSDVYTYKSLRYQAFFSFYSRQTISSSQLILFHRQITTMAVAVSQAVALQIYLAPVSALAQYAYLLAADQGSFDIKAGTRAGAKP